MRYFHFLDVQNLQIAKVGYSQRLHHIFALLKDTKINLIGPALLRT